MCVTLEVLGQKGDHVVRARSIMSCQRAHEREIYYIYARMRRELHRLSLARARSRSRKLNFFRLRFRSHDPLHHDDITMFQFFTQKIDRTYVEQAEERLLFVCRSLV